ncbi:uncharacterized protein (UPF0548 family) [Microbacterium sp. AG790]|uniref:DUF1990 family protein n=1 Tax=Microbacterium sp. AG790 TaxID=2183995 RepID=UPI000F1FF7DF|nr:uncharacterized protein (UPF0548 family) [Microbacterium sp. AG790]
MVGAEFRSRTQPAQASWTCGGRGYRRWEKSTTLGSGTELWEWVTTEVMRWGVKTRSGFSVSPASAVTVGIRPLITARAFGVSIREPVEVVEVVQTSDRVGFAYRTLAGHPVSGEEAFIVHRDHEHVVLTIRSLARAADHSRWRFAFPVLLLAQKVARRRYMRALRGTVAGEREASSSRS